MLAAGLLVASLELVSAGEARLRVEADATAQAQFAADLLRQTVILITGVALPEMGHGPALRLEHSDEPGYALRVGQEGATLVGSDLVRAAFDLLEGWGCRLDRDPPLVPRRESLFLIGRVWRPDRELWIDAFDPAVAAQGVAISGLARYEQARPELALKLGYPVRVASTSFDDFLPPEILFDGHPEWFALREGRREARGNFALTNEGARTAYLDRLGQWLEAHDEVACVGIWPEVTQVWCEESVARGHAESYALLWREAARRFPARRFEILATGLTLRPPAGQVPANVEVRLRPGRDASGLQGVAGQAIEAVVRAWEVRGARVVLEIDAAPDSWCGMPWPCHDAVRADARRFRAAVIRGGAPLLARIWRDPEGDHGIDERTRALLDRARDVRTWGHPRDAADLFLDESFGDAFRIATTERLVRIAADETGDPELRRTAAADAFLAYLDLIRDRPHGAVYRRYRRRQIQDLVAKLVPEGVVHRVGPARVREALELVEIETDRLRLVIDRGTASVTSIQRLKGLSWSENLCGDDGRFFAVVSTTGIGDRGAGSIDVSASGRGQLRVDLSGHITGVGGWRTRLDLRGGSGVVQQTSEVKGAPGVAAACSWSAPGFDRWVCPPYATEGRLAGAGAQRAPAFRMPPMTLLYCRSGEEGIGVAARLPHGGVISPASGIVTTRRGPTIQVDWIIFTTTAELGKVPGTSEATRKPG